ncbi:MAG: M15 family metallopeptidase [Acidobacteria bacterium]|nr:M15 family metallopeptidase [Acidobacteriota bacterium]
MIRRRLPMVFLALAAVVSAVPSAVSADTANAPLPETRQWTSPMKHAISISRPIGFSLAVRARIRDAAASIGAEAYPGRAAMFGMSRIEREGRSIQRIPRGMQVPMSTTVQPDEVVRNLMSVEAADALLAGGIVMGDSSARFRGAREGDVVTLIDKRRRPVTFVIGLVAEDDVVGGGDLLMSPTQADLLGATTVTRYTVTGFRNPDTAAAALAAAGFVNGMDFRVRRTWDERNPDATLGLGEAKLLVGEFAYKITKSGKVTADPGWVHQNITPRRFFSGIPVRAGCHRRIWAPLQGALNEIKREGLDELIDVDNTNQFGGCFYARLNRISGDLGYLSRHSWGMAFDMNTTTNAQGRAPNLDCRIVRIFRKWGFAWGGNFTPADGMHFEYVGERRDNIEYPSRYCPNVVGNDR